MGTVKERVARGVALLDERVPGWRKRIDLSAFNFESLECCVLGQLYGGWGRGVRALFNAYDGTAAKLHGFDSAAGMVREEMPQFHDEWVRVLTTK
jgi:hypothetical protein